MPLSRTRGCERTSRGRQALIAIAAATLALVVIAASSAFACVPQPLVMVGAPGAGKPGDKLAVHGLRFGSAATELRWSAIDGPLLGSTSGGDFDAEVTIPPSAPGAYVIVALMRLPDGSVGSIALAPVVVSGDPAPVRTTTKGSARGSSVGILVSVFALIALVAVVVAGTVTRRSRRARPSAARVPAGVAAP